MLRRAIAACVLAALGACSGSDAPPDAPPDAAPPGTVTKLIPTTPAIDVLFVIDNSSAVDEQTVFATNFPKLVAALDAFPSGRPSLHLGVVDTTIDIGVDTYAPSCPSPDPADNGALQDTARVPGCTPQNGAFIVDLPSGSGGARTTNYSGTLDVALSCIAQVGGTGCGFPAPLEAMRRALDGSSPDNIGFLRTGALLAVIILTDADDRSTDGTAVFSMPDGPDNPAVSYQCDQSISPAASGSYTGCEPRLGSGMTDPASYAAFLDGAKNPAQVVVGVLAGPPPGLATDDVPPLTGSADVSTTLVQAGSGASQLHVDPACTATINGDPAGALPAIRLGSFVGHFADHGRFYSICQGDYSAPLADAALTMYHAVSPCLPGNIAVADTDTTNPGTQLACTVIDGAEVVSSESVIPACAMTDATHPTPNGLRPCWWSANDPSTCVAPDSHFELEIERATPAPSDDVVEVDCTISST